MFRSSPLLPRARVVLYLARRASEPAAGIPRGRRLRLNYNELVPKITNLLLPSLCSPDDRRPAVVAKTTALVSILIWCSLLVSLFACRTQPAEDLILEGSERSVIRVRAGTPYSCLMLKNQRFSSLFRHYAKHHGLRKDDLAYYFTEELQNEDTPETVFLLVSFGRGDRAILRVDPLDHPIPPRVYLPF